MSRYDICCDINEGRKRKIGVKYLLRKLFEMLVVSFDEIPLSK